MAPPRPATHELAFTPVDNARLAMLCGALDENLRQIETAFDVTIARRAERFSISGTAAHADLAAQALERFYGMASRELTLEDIQLGLVELKAAGRVAPPDAPALRLTR